MADEYIKREDAMRAACKALCHPGVRCPDNICAEVRDVFDAIPAADVVPVVRGHWIHRRFTENICGEECSVCHTTWDVSTNYCPNCGAMTEVDDG